MPAPETNSGSAAGSGVSEIAKTVTETSPLTAGRLWLRGIGRDVVLERELSAERHADKQLIKEIHRVDQTD